MENIARMVVEISGRKQTRIEFHFLSNFVYLSIEPLNRSVEKKTINKGNDNQLKKPRKTAEKEGISCQLSPTDNERLGNNTQPDFADDIEATKRFEKVEIN